MKIQLERKLAFCPELLLCTVCRQSFGVDKIRALLYSDAGLLQGDVCRKCLKLKASGIKQKLQEQSQLLMRQVEFAGHQAVSLRQLAIERLQCSEEEVRLPRFYEWVLKQIEIFSQESQELEKARLGLSNCSCGRRAPLRITFEDDQNTN